jgi:ParB/RepB/Spo0J family partition protein
MSEQTQQTQVGNVRIVTLSRITPGEDFNPRQARDPERFAQLVASVRADGVLQPLLVTPEPDGDGLRLVAGEGRWLAAGEAGQTEVPVYVVEVDERTGGLELALAENLARQDLDPVQEAHGYERLRAAGLTKKGIAERLGIAQRRVTERLEIPKLPAQLHPRIASGQIPPAAVKPLVALERIHPGLAACAAARVDAPVEHAWEQPLSWTDLVSDPVGVGSASLADALPLPLLVAPLSRNSTWSATILCRRRGLPSCAAHSSSSSRPLTATRRPLARYWPQIFASGPNVVTSTKTAPRSTPSRPRRRGIATRRSQI